jgi:pimeloyl-ACP methyl ester carboxylesterase
LCKSIEQFLVSKNICNIFFFSCRSRELKPGSVHLIGHSLGAHIAGNVGQFFNGTIGRITGLDPAGPLFRETSLDALSSGNALFVDSVHTSSGVLGQMHPIVDASFYPNRGYPPQPGCTALDFFLFGKSKLLLKYTI